MTSLEKEWENAILKPIKNKQKKIKMGFLKKRNKLGGGETIEDNFTPFIKIGI